MKTKLFFLFSFTFSLFATSQETYKSFIHTGVTKWLYYSPQHTCFNDEVDAYGDTLINQMTYKKLWNINFVPSPPYVNVNQKWRDYTQFKGLTNTFLRQSSDSSKMYILDASNHKEYLIADMNLKVGDEFIFPILGRGIVNNVFYNDGLKNIQFNMNSQYNGITFIEGVGINKHFKTLLIGMGGYPHDNYLVCYSNSSYFFNINNICACIDTKMPDVDTNHLKIKKLSDKIVFSFDESSERTWELYNIYGRSLQKSQIFSQNYFEISTVGYKSGIYLLKIYNLNKNEYKSFKIIL